MDSIKNKPSFYITTPIFYPNGDLHIGHAYTSSICDILARIARINDIPTYFLTGADENSLKIENKAKEMNVSVSEYLDIQAKRTQVLFEELNISYDQYIRTTDRSIHHPGAIALWRRLKDKGDIYEHQYKGFYCVGCEGFKTEKDLINGQCPDHGKVDYIEEKNYFFKLSKYASKIKEVIQDGTIKIFPEARKNEILSFIDQGVEDISFSRPYKGQANAILVPDDETQSIYVWCDALVNYISALGFGSLGQELPESPYNIFWNNDNAQNVHVIGKDILKFHTIIWPAMLLSAELPLPKNIVIHGLMMSGGRKMSKTLGNVISPADIIAKVKPEGLRFYFANNIPLFDDGEITDDLIVSVYNSYLSNGIGNLTNRLIKMMISYDVIVEFKNIQDSEYFKKIKDLSINTLYTFDINQYSNFLWKELNSIDIDIQNKEPFKLFKENPEEAKKIVAELIYKFYIIIHFIYPILPNTVSKIISHIQNREMPKEPLFPRI